MCTLTLSLSQTEALLPWQLTGTKSRCCAKRQMQYTIPTRRLFRVPYLVSIGLHTMTYQCTEVVKYNPQFLAIFKKHGLLFTLTITQWWQYGAANNSSHGIGHCYIITTNAKLSLADLQQKHVFPRRCTRQPIRNRQYSFHGTLTPLASVNCRGRAFRGGYLFCWCCCIMLYDGDPSTIHYDALELTDCIRCWSVFGHHTVVAVNIILQKS